MTQPIVVVFLTYVRTPYALRSIQAMRENFIYPDTRYYVADDGSPPEHMEAVLDALKGEEVVGWHSEEKTYGINANHAWRAVEDISPITLWLEDDFVLSRPFNPSIYVDILDKNPDIGLIRFSNLPINLDSTTVGYAGQIFLKLHRNRQYSFSGHPSLRHVRYWKTYGDYCEDRNPGETELDYDWKFRSRKEGPEILWPVSLGEWGIWSHVGEIRTFQ